MAQFLKNCGAFSDFNCVHFKVAGTDSFFSDSGKEIQILLIKVNLNGTNAVFGV